MYSSIVVIVLLCFAVSSNTSDILSIVQTASLPTDEKAVIAKVLAAVKNTPTTQLLSDIQGLQAVQEGQMVNTMQDLDELHAALLKISSLPEDPVDDQEHRIDDHDYAFESSLIISDSQPKYAIGALVSLNHHTIKCVRIVDFEMTQGYRIQMVDSSDNGQRPKMWWNQRNLERLAEAAKKEAEEWKGSSMASYFLASAAEAQKHAGHESISDLMQQGLKQGDVIKAATTASWTRKGEEFQIGEPSGQWSFYLLEKTLDGWFNKKKYSAQGIGSAIWERTFRRPTVQETHPFDRWRENKHAEFTPAENARSRIIASRTPSLVIVPIRMHILRKKNRNLFVGIRARGKR